MTNAHRRIACAVLVSLLRCPIVWASTFGFPEAQSVGEAADIRALVVDRNGFLWSGSNKGVCRFDGLKRQCIVQAEASALVVDAQGALWAALADGSLMQATSGPFTHRVVARFDGTINGIARTEGLVWVATSTGLYTFDLTHENLPSVRVVNEPTNAVVAQSADGVFAAVHNKVLFIASHKPPALVSTVNSEITVALPCPENGSLIVGTMAGTLYQLFHDGRVSSLPTMGGQAIIRSLAQDAFGNLWVGTDNHFFELQKAAEEWSAVSKNVDLPHPHVNALAMDDGGTLWVGTAGGLVRFRNNHPLRSFGRADGLNSHIAFAVTEGILGWVWAVTAAGVAGWKGAWIKDFGSTKGLSGFDARTIAVDTKSRIWVGGTQTGLYELDGDHMRLRWGAKEGGGVRALRPAADGGLWVGLAEGGLGRFDNNHFTLAFAPSAPGRDRVFDLLETQSKDGVWLALSFDGLAQWQAGRLRRYTADGMPPTEVLCLCEGDTGDIWIGTNGAGLWRAKNGVVKAVTAANGLPNMHVFGLVKDKLGKLWMSAPSGISSVALNELTDVVQGKRGTASFHTYQTLKDFPGEPTRAFPPSAARSSDGTLWFPTVSGVVNIDPRVGLAKTKPSTVVFDEAQANGQSLFTSAQVRPVASFNLLFRFATPMFSPGSNLHVRYRLDGLVNPIDPWHEGQDLREAHYQTVPPGDYRFSVQVLDSGGTAPAGAIRKLSFRLPRPWHQTIGFRAAAVACVLALLAIAHRQRVRGVQRAHALVLAERARIAGDIHDSLEQDLVGLRFQIDAASATFATSHTRALAHLTRASELTNDAVVDLRNSIWGLRARDVYTNELLTAIRARLERMTAGSRIQVAVEGSGESRRLPAPLAMHLLHITLEAVTNAVKHGNPNAISVKLNSSAQATMTLQVSDDGKGFGPPAVRETDRANHGRGQGLVSMQARADALGGQLTIACPAEGGTNVTIQIPTEKRAKRGARFSPLA